MAKDPDDRYNSCRELSLAARAALVAADPAAVHPDPGRDRPCRPIAAPVGERDHTVGGVRRPGAWRPRRADDPVEAVSLTTPRPPYTVSVRRTSAARARSPSSARSAPTTCRTTNRIALEELLHRSRFFDLPPRLPLVEVVPGDVLQEITVGNNDVTRTVVYEREGSRRPKELDEIVSLLERLAGWQDPAVDPARSWASVWTPTGSVPPLGAGAVRPTEVNPPAALGYHPTGPTGVLPGGPPPAGACHSGPAAGLPERARRVHRSDASPGQAGRRPKWLLIGLAAVLVIAGGVTAAVLLTRTDATDDRRPDELHREGGRATRHLRQLVGVDGCHRLHAHPQRRDDVHRGQHQLGRRPGAAREIQLHRHRDERGGQTSSPAGPAAVTIADQGWSTLTNVAADFDRLIPQSPSEKGYEDATCTSASDNFGSKADGIINCTDSQGIVFWVMHFPDADTLNAYVDGNFQNSAEIITWTRDDDDNAGTRYGTADDEKTLPYLLTTFNDQQFADYVVYVEWKDHTTQQLIDSWWKPAPF